MRRGFKTHAENQAIEIRRSLKIAATGPLNPWKYAECLGVVVLGFDTLGLSAKSARQLTINDPDCWSAMTIKHGAVHGVVLNPTHKVTRLHNDLTHELAHIDLKHVPSRVEVSKSGLLLLSDYSDEQEQEADWYAGALLLPRNALVHHRAKNKTVEFIASQYGVSTALCEWRIRMTGVDVQIRRSRTR